MAESVENGLVAVSINSGVIEKEKGVRGSVEDGVQVRKPSSHMNMGGGRC